MDFFQTKFQDPLVTEIRFSFFNEFIKFIWTELKYTYTDCMKLKKEMSSILTYPVAPSPTL
jgi:hypothetical protein